MAKKIYIVYYFLFIPENTTETPATKGKVSIWFFYRGVNFQLLYILV